MNGFQMMADSYKKLVEQGKLKEEDAKREIEIYEFLATCDHSDFFRMVDSSAFNDIIKAFCRKALQGAKVTEEVEDSVMGELRWIMDTMQASEICK